MLRTFKIQRRSASGRAWVDYPMYGTFTEDDDNALDIAFVEHMEKRGYRFSPNRCAWSADPVAVTWTGDVASWRAVAIEPTKVPAADDDTPTSYPCPAC